MDDDLRRAPAFADLSDKQFSEIMTQAREVSFPKETIVIEEGAEAKGLFVLIEGEMTVTKHIRGRTVTLSRLEPVNFVGEISVMTGFPPMATVRTLPDVAQQLFAAEHLTRVAQEGLEQRELPGGQLDLPPVHDRPACAQVE